MRRCIIILLTAAVLSTACGCRSLVLASVKPTQRQRHASFHHIEKLFTADQKLIHRKAALIISGNWNSDLPRRLPDTGKIFIPLPKHGKIERGMAVWLEPDGYLLTADHCLAGTKHFVLAEFDGKLDLRPVRIVCQRGLKTEEDIAIIKVPVTFTNCVRFGRPPKPGDPVFGVVVYPKTSETDMQIGMLGGKVLQIDKDSPREPVLHVHADVPIWLGDSGGPLFTGAGDFVGVAARYNARPGWFYWKKQSVHLLPDKEFIDRLIATDRELHP